MTVMLGIGGVLTEALADVAFRLVPITRLDATEMIDDLAAQALLGEVRGEPALDREAMADVLLALSAAAEADPSIVSADLNPLIVVDGRPGAGRRAGGGGLMAVDAGAVPGALRAAGRPRRRRVDPPGQVRLREPPQHPRLRLPGRGPRLEP